jgi:hypothetical protein
MLSYLKCCIFLRVLEGLLAWAATGELSAPATGRSRVRVPPGPAGPDPLKQADLYCSQSAASGMGLARCVVLSSKCDLSSALLPQEALVLDFVVVAYAHKHTKDSPLYLSYLHPISPFCGGVASSMCMLRANCCNELAVHLPPAFAGPDHIVLANQSLT